MQWAIWVIRVRSRQGVLFGGRTTKYFAVVTNIWGDWSAQKLLEWHREKAGSIEAIHDVMKNELAAGVLPCARKIILRLGLGAQRICEWLQARLLLAAPV